MQGELITVLQYLRAHGGSSVVQNAIEVGLTRYAFTVAVNSLHQSDLIVQDGLVSFMLSLGPVGLRLTSAGVAEIERLSTR
jgi:hypothetical protein